MKKMSVFVFKLYLSIMDIFQLQELKHTETKMAESQLKKLISLSHTLLWPHWLESYAVNFKPIKI